MTASINLPVAVLGVEGLRAGHRQDPEADLLGLQPGHDRQQVAHRPGQPVELGDGEGVALADVIEGRLKLLALGHRRHLLAENLVAPGRPKLAFLGFQTGDLAREDVRAYPTIIENLSHMDPIS